MSTEPPRRRAKEPTPRRHTVSVKLSDDEQSLIAGAAGQSGQSAGAWIAETALTAAAAAAIPDDAGYSVTWPSGRVRYLDAGSLFSVFADLATDAGDLDDPEPGESVIITRIRKG